MQSCFPQKTPVGPAFFQWLEEPWPHLGTTQRIFGKIRNYCSDELILIFRIFSLAKIGLFGGFLFLIWQDGKLAEFSACF